MGSGAPGAGLPSDPRALAGGCLSADPQFGAFSPRKGIRHCV